MVGLVGHQQGYAVAVQATPDSCHAILAIQRVKEYVKPVKKTRALLGFCKALILLAKIGVFIRRVTDRFIRRVTNFHP